MASSTGSPCGACKFLRRKCTSECVFAPYFCSDQGSTHFAAMHKVFGASNVSKLLLHVPQQYRCETAVTIAYEAQARIRDPVYGCVGQIFALQQQVATLQAQLIQLKAQLAYTMASNTMSTGGSCSPQPHLHLHHSSSPKSSLDHFDAATMPEMYMKQEVSLMPCLKKMPQCSDLGELQDLAVRMMRS